MKVKDKWNRTKDYCPSCGKRSVWVEDAMGDYYEGPTHICSSCDIQFSLPSQCSVKEYHATELALMKAAKKRTIVMVREVGEPSEMEKTMLEFYGKSILDMVAMPSRFGKTIRFTRQEKLV